MPNLISNVAKDNVAATSTTFSNSTKNSLTANASENTLFNNASASCCEYESVHGKF